MLQTYKHKKHGKGIGPGHSSRSGSLLACEKSGELILP